MHFVATGALRCRRLTGGTHVQDELLSMDPEKITYEMVSKKQRELAQARGRRSTDRQTQLQMLHFLVRVSKGPAQKLEARRRVTPAPRMAAHCMRLCYHTACLHEHAQCAHCSAAASCPHAL